MPPTFVARATFFPETRQTRLPSSLSALAGEVGLSASEPTQSPQFYASLIKSRGILESVLLSKYPNPRTPGARDSVTLLDIYALDAPTRERQIEMGVTRIQQAVTTSVDSRTGMVQVEVSARFAPLAAQIAKHLLDDLNEFNATTRRSQARNRREFVERSLRPAESNLHQTEGLLEGFYEKNRQWQTSPRLVATEQQMHRQVDIAQALYLDLMRQYQQAQIDEVNDVPVVVAVDTPVVPAKRARPKRRVMVLVALVLASFASVSAVAALEYYQRSLSSDPDTWRTLGDAWRTAKADIRAATRKSQPLPPGNTAGDQGSRPRTG